MKIKSKASRIFINLLITLVVGIIAFYIVLPPLNFCAQEFYSFIIGLCVVYVVSSFITSGIHPENGVGGYFKSVFSNFKIAGAVILLMVVIMLLGSLLSWHVIRAGSYRDLIDVGQGDFADDVSEISFDKIPMLDYESASRLGDRKLGELSDMVSQFEVSDYYTQINFNGRPVRATPLEYGDFIKWFNNRKNGIPAYLMIDMASQAVEVVRMPEGEGIKYSPSEHFGRLLDRHIRFKYPTFMFAEPNFEINDDKTPYWVCPRIVKRIGLFGGTDILGAVLVNAVTGECEYFEDVPTWVDRVYPAELIMQQYDYYGQYINGFLNSVFGQRGVTKTTSGYNYIALNDDVYVYTGVTSVGSDQSNVGFLLSNQRTKQTKYYTAAGATEVSAMASAEGVVQHLKYRATFPLLLNVASEPTYFIALKDNASLVKMYAMVNVEQYTVVATGESVEECERKYIKLLQDNNISEEVPVLYEEKTGIITDIRSAVISGNTYYYLKFDGNEYYAVNAAEHSLAIILNPGDVIKVRYEKSEDEILRVTEIEKQ